MSNPRHRRSQLNRADLLTSLSVDDAPAAQFVAEQLGLLKQHAEDDISSVALDVTVATIGMGSAVSGRAEAKRGQKDGVKPEVGFWLLERRESTVLQDVDEGSRDASTRVGWTNRPLNKPAYYPLVSPRSLLPRLFHHLKHQRLGRELDVDAVMKKLGRGEYLYHIPRASRRSLGRHLHIIEDRHLHLTPYWLDQGLFANLLESHLPDYANSRDVLVDGQVDHWVVPPANSVVLVFSDLGALSNNPVEQINGWLRIGAALQRSGCKLIAVVPCHPDECDSRLRDVFAVESWEPQRQLDKQNKVARRQQADELLSLLAPAIRLEPGLLRSVRRAVALHGFNFDASVEAAVWQHPDMQELSSVAATPNSAARQQRMEHFSTLAETLKQTVLDIIREWRAPLREEVWFEEITSLDIGSRECVPASDLADANHYFRQLGKRYVKNADEVRADVETSTWFRRMERRLPTAAWDLPEVGAALQQIAVQVHKDDQKHHVDHPLDPAKLAALDSREYGLGVHQQGEYLMVVQKPMQADLQMGSHLSNIWLRRPVLYAEAFAGLGVQHPPVIRQSLQFQLLEHLHETVCPLLDVTGLMLRSDVETLYFKQIQKPLWADSIGRDAEGLFIEHHCLGNHYRSYWQPPTTDGAGHWQGFPSGDIGTDDYGLYADLSIQDITQRFRWIEPGTFLMGSPESEADREPWTKGSETQHPVTLTQGFWLADTTVTQSLWQAVMGNNPSRFNDNPNNPVEKVSWNDSQEFIKKLNSLLPGLQAKLPTEAQWEYACRAETTTPFSFGDNITPEQVNYDGNYPYANGEKGLYREKTVPVKSLPANPWGLYEMHGNVWEWCQDVWQEKLPASPVKDPEGVAGGDQAGVGRVVRGGSWFGHGRYVRSAFRLRYDPADRYNGIGFRLALGLELQPASGAAEPQNKQERTAGTQTGASGTPRQAGSAPGAVDKAGKFIKGLKNLFGK